MFQKIKVSQSYLNTSGIKHYDLNKPDFAPERDVH